MGINYSRSEQKVQEIYRDFTSGSLIIDESYQRRSVWIERDKIRLIETMLLGLIIPELYFWDAEIDADSGITITHIVDGQQRVKTIIDFINNKLKLQKEHLIDTNIKNKFGDLYFKDLDEDTKKQIWSFNLSVIRIKNDDLNEIRNIFYRVNLTSYSLNDQERRHSKTWGCFADLTSEIFALPIWDKYELFNAGDIRRMKDEEFCSTLLLLAKKGIIDQTTQKPLNDAYVDYADNYPDYENDKMRVIKWTESFSLFYKDSLRSFFKKRTQLYTIFCLIDYLQRNSIEITNDIINRLHTFIDLYMQFENTSDATTDNSAIYNTVKQYKLASSEGVNKIRNRKIRFELLRDFVLKTDSTE